MYEGRWWTARTAWCFFTNSSTIRAAWVEKPVNIWLLLMIIIIIFILWPWFMEFPAPACLTHTHTHTWPWVRQIRLKSPFPAADQCSGGAIRIKGLTAGHSFHSPVPHIYKTRPSEIFILYTEGSISHSDSFHRSLSHQIPILKKESFHGGREMWNISLQSVQSSDLSFYEEIARLLLMAICFFFRFDWYNFLSVCPSVYHIFDVIFVRLNQ